MVKEHRKMKVWFGTPQHGWMELTIVADDETFSTTISHIPYDSLSDLTKALLTLLEGIDYNVVTLNTEPTEYEIRFERLPDEDMIQMTILRYPDSRRVNNTGNVEFSLKESCADICLPFWRALRDLQSRVPLEEFKQHWSPGFPASDMQVLTQRIR